LDHERNGVTIERIADLVGHRTTIVTRKVLRDTGLAEDPDVLDLDIDGYDGDSHGAGVETGLLAAPLGDRQPHRVLPRGGHVLLDRVEQLAVVHAEPGSSECDVHDGPAGYGDVAGARSRGVRLTGVLPRAGGDRAAAGLAVTRGVVPGQVVDPVVVLHGVQLTLVRLVVAVHPQRRPCAFEGAEVDISLVHHAWFGRGHGGTLDAGAVAGRAGGVQLGVAVGVAMDLTRVGLAAAGRVLRLIPSSAGHGGRGDL